MVDVEVTNLTSKPILLARGDEVLLASATAVISTAVVTFEELLRLRRAGKITINTVFETVKGHPYTDFSLKPDAMVTNLLATRLTLPLASEGGGVITLQPGETQIISTYEVSLPVLVDACNDGAISIDDITNTLGGAPYNVNSASLIFGQFEVDLNGDLLLHFIDDPAPVTFEITSSGYLEIDV